MSDRSAVWRNLLRPFGWGYGFAVQARNIAFDSGLLKVRKVDVPVVSVGNLTAGGTGKTPLVEMIARYVQRAGRKCAIVSRGYGRETRGVVVVSDGERMITDASVGGDEPVQLARRNPGVVVVVGERRVDAAMRARSGFNAELIIADDAFQHRYLHRDMDVLVVDGTRDIRSEPMLPAGDRREWLRSASRANMLGVSHAAKPDEARRNAEGLARWYKGPVMLYRHAAEGIFDASDHRQVAAGMFGKIRALAFSGIGKHRLFVDDVRGLGVHVADDVAYADHHEYDLDDVETLGKAMAEAGAGCMITTEKDLVRIQSNGSILNSLTTGNRLLYMRIKAEVVSGGDEFFGMLDAMMEGRRPV